MVGGKDWRNHKVADHQVQCIIQIDRIRIDMGFVGKFPSLKK